METMLDSPYLIIDFETKDCYIGRQFGAGWVFNLNHYHEDFRILGMGWELVVPGRNETISGYETDIYDMLFILEQYSHMPWVFFNAQYDMGCILVVLKANYGAQWERVYQEEFSKNLIIDTEVLARAHNQDLRPYSLDNCCKHWNLQHKKLGHVLDDYVWESGMYQDHIKFTSNRNIRTRPSARLLHKFAITNLDRLPESVVREYCLADVYATRELAKHLIPTTCLDLGLYSELIREVLDIRRRGICIDLQAAREASENIQKLEKEIETKQHKYIDYNWHSGADLSMICDLEGVSYTKTNKGAPSIKGKMMEHSGNDALVDIAKWRKYNKIRTCFIDKIIKYQSVFTDMFPDGKGKVYISLNIFGASTTGRFTSGPYRQDDAAGDSSFELNVQQIPARDEILGPMVRKLFIAQPGYKMIVADFSNQEPRLQVHISEKLGIEGAEKLGDRWRAEPELSIHQMVADITGLPKKDAKTINLGLAYGMGAGKLCAALGFKSIPKTFKQANGTVISYQAAGKEGKAILDQYHAAVPHVSKLGKLMSNVFKQQGYIRTLDGRKLNVKYIKLGNGGIMDDSKDGCSRWTQGSAAGQTIQAMVDARKAGLRTLIQVHDELVIEAPEEDANLAAIVLEKCMVNAFELTVPVVVEVGVGNNWSEAK